MTKQSDDETGGSSVTVRALWADDAGPGDLPRLSSDQNGPTWRRTVVATIRDQIVGFASVRLDPVHDSYFCEVGVTQSHRRQGIGTKLYRAACAVAEYSYPMQTRAMSSQPLRRLFAESIGCRVVIHCPQPFADPTQPEWQRWITGCDVPAGYLAVPMGDLSTASVKAAWAEYYQWAHEPFSRARPDQLAERWSSYQAGLDPTLSMLIVSARQDKEIVAFSLVSPDVWDGRTMIVTETVRADQDDGAQVLKAAVAASLKVLGERGVSRVELEGHTTDAHFPGLVASLPPHDADPMDILELSTL